jgi:multisubunit Na+/H+ antiporter MnhE subunit
MSGILVRAAGLTAIYLLVLTSLEPGDVLVGGLLGLATALALRPRAGVARRATTFAGPRAFGAPGFVEIPREGRTPGDVAVWGVLTGEAPDEIPVDVEEERGVLIVHLLDGSDPDAVRERHARLYRRWQAKGGR